jgi:hypothetical protein
VGRATDRSESHDVYVKADRDVGGCDREADAAILVLGALMDLCAGHAEIWRRMR